MRFDLVMAAMLAATAMTASAAQAAPTGPALAAPAAPAPREPALGEGRAGDLQILQLWTRDPAAFLAAWNQPTPPTLVTSSATERNLAIQQYIIFSTCRADAAGNCRLTARVTITDPDGAAYGDPMEFTVWDDRPAPPPQRLVLGANSIGLIVEDGEKLGTYRIRLSVTDAHAGVTAESVAAIDVREAGSGLTGSVPVPSAP